MSRHNGDTLGASVQFAPSTHPKMALVLGGGGAKGAYQVGVWRALEEYKRTNFKAIAGTSVGALNALLFATTDSKSAISTWMKLADFGRRSPRWQTSAIAWISTIAIFITPLLIVLSVLCLWRLSPAEIRQKYFFVLAIALAIGASGILSVLIEWNRLWGPIAPLSNLQMTCLVPLFALPCGMPLMYCVFATHYLEFGKWHLVSGIARFLIAGFVYLCGEGAWGWYTTWFRNQYQKAMGSSLLDRQSLELLVNEQLQATEEKTESWKSTDVIATVAKYCKFWDPSCPKPESINTVVSRPPGCIVDGWIPQYFNVTNMTREQRRRIFLESAALPFVFPNSYEKEVSYCDGGITDNLPIAPVLSGAGFDLVIAVALSPMRRVGSKKLYKRLDAAWGNFLKGIVIANPHNPLPTTEEAEERQRGAYFSRFELTKPSRHINTTPIVLISPAWPLALIKLPIFKFFTGTLHFEAKMFELWIEQGYKDARKALDPVFGEPQV